MTLEQLLETQLEAIKTHRGGARFEYQKGPRRIVKIRRRAEPWRCCGRPADCICGKRLKALLPVLIESMERHGPCGSTRW